MIKTPHGISPPIAVNRGTIQGDSLSPFLFLVYLEPLLRWLTVGGRGYQPGSLPPNSNVNCAYFAYADDLNAMADNHKQLLVHAEKISQYATWGNLIVSPTKTSVTGILYQSHPDKPTDPAMLKRRLNEVTIQGHHMPFHDPTKPFTILGVEFTMNLNWDAQYKTMLTTVTDKCRNLQRSDARPNQVQRIVESCIKGKIKYGLALMCYSMDQLETVNKKVDTALKKAFRLPIGAPTAFIRETTSRAGLGHHSLIADCSYTANKSLTTALNHDGKLGALTRALIELQLKLLTHPQSHKHGNIPKYAFRVRQLIICHRAGHFFMKDYEKVLQLPDFQSFDYMLDQWTFMKNSNIKPIVPSSRCKL